MMNHHQDYQIQNPDQFQGYIQRAVEDIDQNLEELNEKIMGCSRQIANLKWKVAEIGGGAAVVVSLVMALLTGFLQFLIKK
jgi:peptidoglycan hydrolase CwlO-like protein